MAQSIVCGGCGSAVPYGRLACPECGEMLASVVGAGRPASATAVSSAAPATRTSPPAIQHAAPSASAPIVPAAVSAAPVWPGNGAGALPWPPLPADAVGAGDRDDAPDDDAWDDADDSPDHPGPPSSASVPLGSSAAASVGHANSGQLPLGLDDRARPAAPAPQLTTTPAAALARPVAPTWTAAPGAYVPPVLQPAGPAAPARTWAGHGPTLDTGATDASPTAGDAEASASGGDRIDVVKATEFVGWLAIAGGMFAAVGFLLPWSVSVIGASGVEYFDRWGLAGPGHLLVVAAVLGVVAAAALRDRVPIWLGIGLPGLALGALLLGLVWPYLVGPLGAELGVTAVTVGAAMLAAAGVGAIVVDRHARAPRGV